MTMFGKVFLESLPMAIVGYCISLSLAKVFANKLGYKVNGSQELLAQVRRKSPYREHNDFISLFWHVQGLANVAGSFFLCPPTAAAMERTVVQVTAGGKTQLTSFVSAILLIFILLFIGPIFESLPKVTKQKTPAT